MIYLDYIEKYLCKKVSVYKIISSGRDYEVYIVDNLVFRFPKNKQSIDQLLHEKCIVDLIQPNVYLKIPKLKIVDDSFFVYPLIDGEQLPYKRISYSKEIIRDLGIFLQELHSIPTNTFPKQIINENSDLGTFVGGLKEKIEQRLLAKIGKEKINAIFLYMDELFFTFKGSKEVIVHTDLQGKNIIYNSYKKEILGIIDFSDARIGSIELDFCHFYDIHTQVLKDVITIYNGGIFDKDFYDRVLFLARRSVIFEICNDEIFSTRFDHIMNQLKNYKFI